MGLGGNASLRGERHALDPVQPHHVTEHLLWWRDSVWKRSRNFWGEAHPRDLEFNVWGKASI